MGAMAMERPDLRVMGGGARTPADEDLLRAFLDGDHDAVTSLVARYERPLYAFICRTTGRPDVAADIFQDTFVRVVRHAGSFGGRSRFRTWLYTIAANLCRTRGAREAREPGTPVGQGEPAPAAAAAPGPELRLIEDEVGRRVARAVDALPPEQRDVFVLKAYEELSFAEIAEVLGRPVGTTKSQMRAAVQRLRGELADMARRGSSR